MNMDLLCSESISNEYENENLCTKQNNLQQPKNSPTCSNSNLCSKCSTLSSSSCCSTSSGYQSSTSQTSSDNVANVPQVTAVATSASVSQQSSFQNKQHNQHNTAKQHNCSKNNQLKFYNQDYVNTATKDPTILSDRCLQNLVKIEGKSLKKIGPYFITIQKDITPPMRTIVVEWMMEVCDEEKCQKEVVYLAIHYMDRFLNTKSVRKTHLQILAAACLLLASKLREPSCRAFSAELLVFYTDNSIYKSDLIKWELCVLSRLGWDLSSVTPLDFLELLLIRLPIKSAECPDLNIEKVRQHAHAFISLAAKEHTFFIYTASTIAASSIAAALRGLNWHIRTDENMRHLLNILTDLTSVEQDCLYDCVMKLEAIFEEHSRTLEPYLANIEAQKKATHQQQTHHSHSSYHHSSSAPSTPATTASVHHSSSHSHSHNNMLTVSSCMGAVHNSLLPDLTLTCKMQANAHKDVQDLKF